MNMPFIKQKKAGPRHQKISSRKKKTFLRKNQAKNLINNKETLVLPKECTLPKKQDPWK